MTRVLIYDDSAPRRESLETFLQLTPGFECAGAMPNCSTIVEDIRQLKPDLILMDIEMPEKDGIEGVRMAKQNFPAIRIIMQTAYDDDDKVFAALQAGAEGYLLKSASLQQMKQSIEEVMQGGASMSPGIALKVMRYFSSQQPRADYGLTNKETAVLTLLADGLSYKMIADQLQISYHTVNNHVKKIYEKLQVHSLGEAVALAHRQKII
jgi:DNA-binding NarL/FixJ family response regulator